MSQVSSQLWGRFEIELEALNRRLVGLKALLTVIDDTVGFALQNNIPVSIGQPIIQRWIDRIMPLASQAERLNTAVMYTQIYGAGVQPAYDGDFDIVIPPGLPEAQLNAATVSLESLKPRLDGPQLGIAPLLIYGGIAVVALVTGAVSTVALMNMLSKDIEGEMQLAQIDLEKQIAANPEILPEWTEYKKTVQKESRSIVDDFLGPGSGKAILGGAATLGALLIGGYFLMKAFDRKGARI